MKRTIEISREILQCVENFKKLYHLDDVQMVQLHDELGSIHLLFIYI